LLAVRDSFDALKGLRKNPENSWAKRVIGPKNAYYYADSIITLKKIGEIMLNRPLQILIFAICLAFLASVAAVERPVAAQCEKLTDDQIVTDIYGQIRADKSLATQTSHINVVSLYAAVKLQGWTATQRDFDKLNQIALGTNCVRLVNISGLQNQAPGDRLGGCASGMKACGDICIPSGDACNITGALRLLFRPRPDGELALVFVSESSCH